MNCGALNPLGNKGLSDTAKLGELGLRAHYLNRSLDCGGLLSGFHNVNISGAYLKYQAPLLAKSRGPN